MIDTGTWESPTNWNPNLVPDTITEGARVEGYLINVGSSFTLHTLEVKGAGHVVMNDQNEMQVTKLLTAGGTLSGTGTIRITDGGGQSGSIGHTWDGLNIIMQGGSFEVKDLTLNNSPFVENQDTFLFPDGASIGDTNLISLPEPLPTTFLNTGFLRKEAGSGTAVFAPRFENDGEFFSGAGTLRVTGGGINRGAFRTEGDGILRFQSRDVTFTNGSAITGTGTTFLSGARFLVEGDAVVPVNNFEMDQGTSRIGGEGEFQLSGTNLQIDQGQTRDSFTMRVLSGAELKVSGQLALHETSLLEVDSGGTLILDHPNSELWNWGFSTVRNNGLMDFTQDGDIDNNGPINELSFMTFENNSTMRKTGGSGTTAIAAIFENNSIFSSSSGILQLVGDGVNRGEFTTEVDGEIRITSTDLVFEDGSSITGTGMTTVQTGYIKLASGSTIPANNFGTNGSSSRIGGDGELQLTGTALEFKAAQLRDDLVLRLVSGAILDVTGGVTFHENVHLINESGSSILLSTPSSTFTNSGVTIFDNFGTIEISDNASITNNGPVSDLSFMDLNNDGLIRKTGGTGTSILANDLENDGQIFVSSGTIQVASKGVNRGIFETEGDGILRISSSDLVFENGSSIIGTGTTKLASGFIKAPAGATIPVNNFMTDGSGSRFGGDGIFHFSGDALEFNGGQTRDNVTLQLADGASLSITSGITLYDSPELVVGTGSLLTLTANNGSITNSGLSTLTSNGTIIFAGDADIGNNGPVNDLSFLDIENNGSIVKTDGTGDSFLAFGDYSGTGLLRVETGTIRLSGILGTNELTGSVEVLSGATLRGASNLNILPGASLSGAGTIRATSVNLLGSTAPGMSIGTLAITGKSFFEDTSSFQVEVGAAGAADKLEVSGDATIDGQLVATLDGAYVPFDGDSWTILTANSVTGFFDTVSAPPAEQGFGYFVDYNSQSVTLNYEFIGFRRALEQALGTPISAAANLDDYVDVDSDGDGLSDLLEWVFGTDIANPDTGHGLQILSFDEQTPQTVKFRAPSNPFALDAILMLEVAESPEGTYTEVPMIPLFDEDEIIDGLLYQSFEAEISGGPGQARFFRLNARLGDL
ncbi:MAG: beta strand repeat-containing protein [Puniceicoccaceae bacterium]